MKKDTNSGDVIPVRYLESFDAFLQYANQQFAAAQRGEAAERAYLLSAEGVVESAWAAGKKEKKILRKMVLQGISDRASLKFFKEKTVALEGILREVGRAIISAQQSKAAAEAVARQKTEDSASITAMVQQLAAAVKEAEKGLRPYPSAEDILKGLRAANDAFGKVGQNFFPAPKKKSVRKKPGSK